MSPKYSKWSAAYKRSKGLKLVTHWHDSPVPPDMNYLHLQCRPQYRLEELECHYLESIIRPSVVRAQEICVRYNAHIPNPQMERVQPDHRHE